VPVAGIKPAILGLRVEGSTSEPLGQNNFP
jgi:hypothetical protein